MQYSISYPHDNTALQAAEVAQGTNSSSHDVPTREDVIDLANGRAARFRGKRQRPAGAAAIVADGLERSLRDIACGGRCDVRTLCEMFDRYRRLGEALDEIGACSSAVILAEAAARHPRVSRERGGAR
jgi:hypothetical protein